MKKLGILFLALCFTVTLSAQEKKGKNAKVAIEADGVCMMCKKRIESAALKTKGVKFASWNVKTHKLSLILDERKTSLENVQQNIAAVGHDTKLIKAKDEVYNSIHACCKYRDQEVEGEPQ